MNANSQKFWHVFTASRTELAGMIWGHSNYFTTGSFSLVSKHIDETRPSYVGNRSSESGVPEHPSDVQAFHSDLISVCPETEFVGPNHSLFATPDAGIVHAL